MSCVVDEICTDLNLPLQEYSVQLTFREQWLDERLKFNDFNGKNLYISKWIGIKREFDIGL